MVDVESVWHHYAGFDILPCICCLKIDPCKTKQNCSEGNGINDMYILIRQTSHLSTRVSHILLHDHRSKKKDIVVYIIMTDLTVTPLVLLPSFSSWYRLVQSTNGSKFMEPSPVTGSQPFADGNPNAQG
jgi:hypothetical protein